MDAALFKQQTGQILTAYSQDTSGKSFNCINLWNSSTGETSYGIYVSADADLEKNYDGTIGPWRGKNGVTVSTTITADKQIVMQDDPGPSPVRLIAGVPCAEVDSFRACRYKDYTLMFYPQTKGKVTDVLVESALRKVQGIL